MADHADQPFVDRSSANASSAAFTLSSKREILINLQLTFESLPVEIRDYLAAFLVFVSDLDGAIGRQQHQVGA